MVFSSHIFLFLFLPIALLGYFLLGKRYKNAFLFLVSLFFYAWGEPVFVILMLFSIAVNYALGIFMYKNKKLCLILACVLDLGTLFAFKYLSFCVNTFNSVSGLFVPVPKIAMPIGISFFTFQILSYVIDVYRGDVKPQKSFIKLGLYISLFPQLIAGPIVRYSDIEKQLDERACSFESFSAGARRFMLGFSKKILIADTVSHIADSAFGQNGGVLIYWLGIIAYTIQIYFDFSGYSDMAIGLGKMFGFEFSENFNYPYISTSIKEFWRRWHISLGYWFRDYVYIPLGGSRCSNSRVIINTVIVFLLTGIWHGAGLNFILWGLYYAVLLVLEKVCFKKILVKLPKAFSWAFTMLAVIFGWVLFRAENLQKALEYLKGMFGQMGPGAFVNIRTDYLFFLGLGVVLSFPILKNVKKGIVFDVVLCGVFFVSVLYMTGSGFSPFLYFRF